MVLVQREVSITFTVTTNRTRAQITTYCTNTVYPAMTTKFNNYFSAFATRTIDATIAQIGQDNGATNIWNINPWFVFSVDVTAARSDEAKEAWRLFLEDCKDSLRISLSNMTGTTVTRMHYHRYDDTTLDVAV